MRRLRLASLGLILLIGNGHATGSAWRTYANPRFGVSVAYPALFSVLDPPPENGDGQGFRTAGGDATLLVFGRYNIDNESADQLMRSYEDPGIAYSYAKATRRWFVLSGSKNGRINYMRCNLGAPDVVGCAELDYRSADADEWSPAVDRISRSLRVTPPR